MAEYQRESQTLKLLNYLRQHPGAVLSISYALLTICGVLYSMRFYREFDIAIMKLANVSDLLIAGLSEPAALLMFLGGILMGVSFDLLSQYTHKVQEKWRQKPKGIKRTIVLSMSYTPKRSEMVMVWALTIFVMYAYLFVSGYAVRQADQVKLGHGNKILLNSDLFESKPVERMLLGSTAEFLIVYDIESELASVMHVENVNNLSPIVERDESSDSNTNKPWWKVGP